MSDSDANRRVVVTGIGAITPQGPTATDLWAGAVSGRVAIREVETVDTDGLRTRLGGEVKERVLPEHKLDYPDGYADPAFDFTIKAAEEAMAHCGVGTEGIAADRWGVVIGTCNAGLLSWRRWFAERAAGNEPDPRLVLMNPPQAIAEAVSSTFGLTGPSLSINTACAASANAIGLAAELIRTGEADAVLTGGVDVFSDILFSGFNALESLSPKPAAPYSIDREGLSLGEGSGMLVLMRGDLAEEHDVEVLAELAGYALSADGYHPTAPQPEGRGAARAIQAAMKAAGVTPEEVAYVNSHGTGTAKNDPAETAATKRGLGEAASRTVAVSSTKSMIGHLLGAAGAAEAIVTVKALHEQMAPPTASFTEPDPECDLDYVPNVARAIEADVAISNNFAFGGANASLVFVRRGARDAPPPADVDDVVITGIATLAPGANDPAALHAVFSEARDVLEDGVLGRVELDLNDYLDRRDRKRVDRIGLFSIISAKLALANAGLELTDDNRTRVGAIVGTAIGPMESMEAFAAPVMAEGPGGANPAVFPNTVYNAAGGQVAIKVGAIGPASTICCGHAAGATALIYAAQLVRSNQADAMIAIAADALTDTLVESYRLLGWLANGAGASGLALSEAGVALTLERRAAAEARGAKVLGRVAGSAVTCDAAGFSTLDPEGAGVERAVRQALERAGLAPADVATVWANACGLPWADDPERAALKRVFGDAVVLQEPKRVLGETLGAGGALSAALAIAGGALEQGPALISSLSLGGTNVAIVLAP